MKEASHDRGVCKMVTIPSSFNDNHNDFCQKKKKGIYWVVYAFIWEVAETQGRDLKTDMKQRSWAVFKMETLQLMGSALNRQPPEQPQIFQTLYFCY